MIAINAGVSVYDYAIRLITQSLFTVEGSFACIPMIRGQSYF